MRRHVLIPLVLLAFLVTLLLPGCTKPDTSTTGTMPTNRPTQTTPPPTQPTEPSPYETVYMLTGCSYGLEGFGKETELTFAYDDAGRLVEAAAGEQVLVSYTYDEQGNCLAHKHVLDDIDKTYDAQGHILTDRTAEGLLTYTYDEAGRCIQLDKHDPDGTLLSVTRYTYDDRGLLLSEVLEQDGSVYSEILHTYDEAGRHLTQTYYRNGEISAEGPSYEWTYNEDCHLDTEYLYYGDGYWQRALYYYIPRADLELAYMLWDSDGNLSDIAHFFNDVGNLNQCVEKVRDPQGNTYTILDQYEYDEHGNTVMSKHVDRDGQEFTYRWSYDESGTVMTGCSYTSPTESYEYTWTFNSRGKKVMEIRAGDNPHEIVWEYDRMGRLLSVTCKGSTPYQETYTYDEFGNLIQLQRQVDGDTKVVRFHYTPCEVLRQEAAPLQAQQAAWMQRLKERIFP